MNSFNVFSPLKFFIHPDENFLFFGVENSSRKLSPVVCVEFSSCRDPSQLAQCNGRRGNAEKSRRSTLKLVTNWLDKSDSCVFN